MTKKNIQPIENPHKIFDVVLEEVMHTSMLPYAEDVILDRAIPRVEDGLKPVQRRILYSMYESGYTPDKPYKKCARIVGDCLGKYHPHGDSSVYGALVRMAQTFAMRMTLVDGHGNFGSVDGDGAAAMRYTEARMSPLALELLRDLDKDTVSWSPNFDDSLEEPNVLPGRFPNLLVNGATGIAVGLATNIPTHNMGEAIDAVVAMIDNPDITTAELLKVMPGPDFPTGGFIIPVDSMESIYETGKGKIIIRSRLHVEDDGGKKNIVITEMPYAVNKSELLVRIAELRDANKDLLQGITDVVDESDKQGMRAVIKCKRDANVDKIVAFLFKKTNLQINYAINMVAIAGGKPELLGLRAMLKYYIAYQKEIIVSRTKFDLKAAKLRAEIVKGLLVAIRNIDEVIRIIKASDSTQKAKEALCARFDLNDDQAQAIVDMRLKALTHLEVGKLEDELAALEKKIAYLEAILKSDRRQYGVIRDEILEIKKNEKVARSSVIIGGEENAQNSEVVVPTAEESIAYRDGVLTLDQQGGIKFVSQRTFDSNVKDKSALDNAPVAWCKVTNKGSTYAFTDMGNMVKIDVTDLAEKKWKDASMKVGQINPEGKPGEKFVKVFFFNSTPVGEFVFFTKDGMVKRSDLSEYVSARAYSQAVVVNDKDAVINVELADADKNILEVTKDGQCLVYSLNEVPVQGKKAAGVKGVKLNDGDSVVFGGGVDEEGEIIVATDSGYLKRVISSTLDASSRYLKGVKLVELDTHAAVKWIGFVKMPYDLVVISDGKPNVFNTEDIRLDTRTTKGKQLVKGKIEYVVPFDED